YAIFSALPERVSEPDYKKRFLMIGQLKGTPHLRQPLWLFDYAMLALQCGAIAEGLNAFRDLRRGLRFFQVPLERTTYLMKQDENDVREVGFMRVVRIDPDGKGWATLDAPAGFKESLPFSVADFRQSSNIQPGRAMPCYIRIRPSGPSAE